MHLRKHPVLIALVTIVRHIAFVSASTTVLLSVGYAAAIVPGFNSTADGRNDDGTYTIGGCNNDSDGGTCDGTLVPIGFGINFYGVTTNGLYINTNGNVTLDFPLSAFSPFGLANIPVQIIAPYFVDVDTRNPASGVVTFGNGTFDGRDAFGVNWIDVGYYDQNVDKTNSFQLLLVDRSNLGPGDFDLIFNYDRILFEAGDASHGTDGLGGDSADVGFSNGSGDPGTFFELPGSGIPGTLIDGGPDALVTHSLNSPVLGRYIFNFRDGTVQASTPEPGTFMTIAAAACLLIFLRRVRIRPSSL